MKLGTEWVSKVKPQGKKNHVKILVTTSWDDGHWTDNRIAEYLTKYELPARFYIPGTSELPGNEIQNLDSIWGVGSHTYHHPQDIKLLTPIQQYNDIAEGKDWLERVVGHEVTHYAHPRGRYNEVTKEQLKKAGITEARTTKILSTEFAKDNYEVATTVHAYNGRTEYIGQPWYEWAEALIAKVFMVGGRFELWGHGLEMQRDDEWKNLNRVLKYLRMKINENLHSL